MTDKATPPIPLVAGELEAAVKNVTVYLEHFPHWDGVYEAYGEQSAETQRMFMADLRTLLAHIKAGEPK